jgi:hypothetical protein
VTTNTTPHTATPSRQRRIAMAAKTVFAGATIAIGALGSATTIANAEPNDGSGFDMNGYISCLAGYEQVGEAPDHRKCCEYAGGYWHPAVSDKPGQGAYCSPVPLSGTEPGQAGQGPTPPPPGAIVILPPGSNTRVGAQYRAPAGASPVT